MSASHGAAASAPAGGGGGGGGGGAVARHAALVAGVQAAQAKLDAVVSAPRKGGLWRIRARCSSERDAEAALAAALATMDAHDEDERRYVDAAFVRAVAALSAERTACEARFAAASAAAVAAGLPAPFRGPAANSALGEALLDVLPLAFRHGHALELHRMRGLCGLTLRERAAPGGAVVTLYGGGELVKRRTADGVRVVRLQWATLYTRERVDERGFLGGPADVMARALKQQAPWLEAARTAPRKDARLHGLPFLRTTSLIRAAAMGDERRVRERLAAGAPLRCVDGRRWTALVHASHQGCARVVEALLGADGAGATVNAQTNRCSTALIKASFYGHEDAVRLLLARGARQGLQNLKGMAALHLAADKGHAGVVELLCAAPGAAVTLRDKRGRTPLDCAVHAGCRACEAMLRAHGAM